MAADFRSSIWFKIGWGYFAVIAPFALAFITDQEASETTRWVAGGSWLGVTLLIAWGYGGASGRETMDGIGRVTSQYESAAVRQAPKSRMTRLANASPGAFVGSLAIAAVLDGDLPLVSPIVAVGLVAGAFLTVRGYNLSVVCAGQSVTVHGFLWTRTIDRADIISVNGFPAITWRSTDRRRWSPVWAFAIPGRALPASQRHTAICVGRLQLWIQ